MFLYYKYVQLWAKHGQLFRYVLLFKVLRGVPFLIVIRILLHTNIIKSVASAKYFHCSLLLCFAGCLPLWFSGFPLVWETFSLFWNWKHFSHLLNLQLRLQLLMNSSYSELLQNFYSVLPQALQSMQAPEQCGCCGAGTKLNDQGFGSLCETCMCTVIHLQKGTRRENIINNYDLLLSFIALFFNLN